jgi:hypothetical protein
MSTASASPGSNRLPKLNQIPPSGETRESPAPPVASPFAKVTRESVVRAAVVPLPSAATALLWGVPGTWDPRACRKLVELATSGAVSASRQKLVQLQVESWLSGEEITTLAAWQGLVWLRQLPAIAALLDADTWQRLADRLVRLAETAADESYDEDLLRYQLLAVEYPAVLAPLLAEPNDVARFASLAERSLLRLANEWLDGEGMPEGQAATVMRPILASWTRCLEGAGLSSAATLKSRDVLEPFVWLLRQSLRLTRGDGAATFAPTGGDTQYLECFERAAAVAGDATATTLLRNLLRSKGRPAAKPKGELPEPSVYSEWGQLGTMRARLQRESPQLTVAFDGRLPQVELAVEFPLLQGEWSGELRVDGETYLAEGPWDEVCWHCDKDAVYLELETRFANGWRLQRQILLAREEGFALFADVVLGDREAQLEYSSSLPLATGMTFQPEAETHDGWLVERSRRWLVLPLGLPEWRSDRPLGSLTATAGRLTLSSQRRGRNLFVPFLIPLNGVRGKLDSTWRRLTVAQQLEIQSPDVAVAYRAQVGDRQWAFYRALQDRGNRTFLGKNLTTEFFAGLFHRSGNMDAIFEVE